MSDEAIRVLEEALRASRSWSADGDSGMAAMTARLGIDNALALLRAQPDSGEACTPTEDAEEQSE